LSRVDPYTGCLGIFTVILEASTFIVAVHSW